MKQIGHINKKVLSFLISLMLLMSVMGTTALAVGANGLPDNEFPAYSTSKADLSYEFLGTTDTLALNPTMPTNSSISQFSWKENAYVWIGVYVEGMQSKLSDMFTTNGLKTLTLSLAFDSNYFGWSDSDATRTFKTISGVRDTAYVAYPYTEEEGERYPHYIISAQNSTVGGYTSSSEYNHWGKISLTNTADLNSIGIAQITMNFDTSTFTLGADQAMFQGNYLKDEKTLVGIFPIKMVGNTAPEAGTKALQGVFGASRFTLLASQDNAFNLNSDSPAETNLSEKFNIVNGGLVNLFPTTYNVEFYNDYGITNANTDGAQIMQAGGSDAWTLNVPEDATFASAVTASTPIPGTDAFTSPTASGYFLETEKDSDGSTDIPVWYYLKDGTTLTKFDKTKAFDATYVADLGIDGTTPLKLYAGWKEGHEVTFKSNDAYNGPTETDKVVYVNPNGTTKLDSSQLPKWAKDGWAISGWNTQADGLGTSFDVLNDAVTGDMDLYAQWTQMIAVTFYPNNTTDGSVGKAEVVYVTPGSTMTTDGLTAPTFTRDGYVFDKWNTESNGSGTDYDKTTIEGTTFSTTTTDKIFYAIWKTDATDAKEDVTVTFNANLDGVTANPPSVTINKGDTLFTKDIPQPAKTDYTFDGWYASSSISDTDEIDFANGYTVDETQTVYGHWTYNGGDAIKINFVNGTTTNYATVTVAPGFLFTNDTLPTAPTKDGYSFTVWNTAEDGKGTDLDLAKAINSTNYTAIDTSKTPNELTFYAQFVEDITIKFDANGGTLGEGTVDLKGKPDTKFVEPANEPVHGEEGYYFLGWNTAANGGGTAITGDMTYAEIAAAAKLVDSTVTSEVTLYAYWGYADPPDDGGDEPEVHDDTVIVWFMDNAPSEDITASANPRAVYAKYGETIADVGPNAMPTPPTRTGYKFLSWNTWETGEGITFTKDTELTDAIGVFKVEGGQTDFMVYAQWEGTEDPIKVTFMDNTVGGEKHIEYTINKGDALGFTPMPPEAPSVNHIFDDWYIGTAAGDGSVTLGDAFTTETTFSADTVVYAKWIEKINVFFYPNYIETDDSSAIDPIGVPTIGKTTPNVAYDGEIPEEPTRDGYTFLGWNTKKNGTGETYDKDLKKDGSLVVFTNGDPGFNSLYAMWDATKSGTETADDVTVTFNTVKSATINPDKITVNNGDAIYRKDITDDPVVSGYTFLGWFDGPNVDATKITQLSPGGNALEAYTVTQNVTLYAHWAYADTSTAITVNFVQKNGDSAGSITVAPGDIIAENQLPKATDVDDYTFDGWKSANGTKLVGGTTQIDTATFGSDIADNKLTLTATYTTDLLIVANPTEYTYNGQTITPTFKVYYIKDADNLNDLSLQEEITMDAATFAANFDVAVYSYKDMSAASQTATEVKNAGKYVLNVTFKNGSDLEATGAKINVVQADIEVKPAALNVTVAPSTQQYKVDDANRVNGITVAVTTGLQASEAQTDAFAVNYYSWKDDDTANGTIEDGELTKIAAALDTLDVGKYLTKLETTNNYVISSVTSSEDGKAVLTWSTTDYPTGSVGTNLLFEIQANDPSLTGVTVQSSDNKDESGAITPVIKPQKLWDSTDYDTEATFDSSATPTVDEYYILVDDVDADDIILTPTAKNPSTTNITVSVTAPSGVTVTDNGDGTYTVPLTDASGNPVTEVTITTKAGDAADAPTITYTFYVKQVIAPTLTMQYGNSPVGLIRRDTTTFADDTARDAAVAAFVNSDAINLTYGSGMVPVGGQTSLIYVSEAWKSYKDGDGEMINYDIDPYALFAYQASTFKLPGVNLTDELGNVINDATVTVEFKVMEQTKEGVSDYSSNTNVTEITLTPDAGTTNQYTLGQRMIRSDVYTVKYSYEYEKIDGTKEVLTAERPVIILGRIGDIYLNVVTTINDSDVDYLKKNSASVGTGNSLVAYRSADIVYSLVPTINDSDIDYFKKNSSAVGTSTTQYYKALD